MPGAKQVLFELLTGKHEKDRKRYGLIMIMRAEMVRLEKSQCC
ncbi:hypothetical protein SAMN05421690_101833 [Nitrosomonas sp. Nm51]|nr:hypothetical protein SAMN05421690_101833 [Nitrosomonas sp. Nm51]